MLIFRTIRHFRRHTAVYTHILNLYILRKSDGRKFEWFFRDFFTNHKMKTVRKSKNYLF